MAIRKKIIDKVSDVLSYPARRSAKKSMETSDKELKFVKSSRKEGYKVKREGKEIIAYPKGWKNPKAEDDLPSYSSGKAPVQWPLKTKKKSKTFNAGSFESARKRYYGLNK